VHFSIITAEKNLRAPQSNTLGRAYDDQRGRAASAVWRWLAVSPYVFSRFDAERGDRVVVAPDAPAGATIPVARVFSDGQALRDSYTGTAYVAQHGSVAVARAGQVVLVERLTH
jgi:hypothetical protein